MLHESLPSFRHLRIVITNGLGREGSAVLPSRIHKQQRIPRFARNDNFRSAHSESHLEIGCKIHKPCCGLETPQPVSSVARKGKSHGCRFRFAWYEPRRFPSRFALRELERHSCDPAHVDADRRQSPPEALPAGESLVECDALSHRRGMTTSPMPYQNRDGRDQFDFIDHKLIIEISDRTTRVLDLKPQSVADFYRRVHGGAGRSRVNKIWTMPVEVAPPPIPFEQDYTHASYDAEAVHRFWLILAWVDECSRNSGRSFIGKVQSGALLLGKLRSCGDALLGKNRAPAAWRRPVTRKRIRTKSAALGSGLVAATLRGRHSIPTPRPSRPVLRSSTWDPQRPSIIRR